MSIFKLPDLGEGLPDAEIVEWHVKEGDTIEVDSPLVAMETAKAIVEVPSPFSGIIVKLFGNKGDVVTTGSPLVEFTSTATSATTATRPATDNATTTQNAATVAGKLEVGSTIITENNALPMHASSHAHEKRVKATPLVRALAARLQMDLHSVTPTGPENTITAKDVENAKAHLDTLGPIETLKGTRRAMAQIMIRSHAEVVPVTVVDDAILPQWNKSTDITVQLIKAIFAGVKKEPALNAWYDSRAMGRRIIQDVNIGLAIDTPEGLFVPVIHGAQKLSDIELRKRVDELKTEVNDRSIKPEDLKGGSIILSNFGKFAGRYASPIVVPPTVAIVGVGKLKDEVVAMEGVPRVCLVLPISLTFDHRALTGGESTRFLAGVIEYLEKESK